MMCAADPYWMIKTAGPEKGTDMLRLCIIVLNYRTPSLCIAAANTVLDALEPGMHLAVVDNHSQDRSDTALTDWHRGLSEARRDQCSLFLSPANTGFSGGNLYAMTRVEARHYLLLNSDTEVRPNALGRLLDMAEQHPEAGLIAPKLLSSDGTAQPSLYQALGLRWELSRSAATGLLDRLIGQGPFAHAVGASDQAFEWVSFACVLITHRALVDVGFLDDGFFMYFEDADYCRSVRDAGLSILTCR